MAGVLTSRRTAMAAGLLPMILVATGATVPAVPAVPADPPGAVLEIESTAGSGCPRGSVDIWPGHAASRAAIRFHRFAVAAGAVAKECVARVRVTAPQGWTYAMRSFGLAGTLMLDDGHAAHIAARAAFTMDPPQLGVDRRFMGPVSDTWEHVAVLPVAVYGDCTVPRVINVHLASELQAHRSAQPAAHSWDLFLLSLDNFLWKPCRPGIRTREGWK